MAYYPFNGNANDGSGNGLNGNGGLISYVSDRFETKGSAVAILSKGYIDLPPEILEKVNSSKEITASIWIKADVGPTVNDPLLHLGQPIQDQTFGFYTFFDKISYSQWGVTYDLITDQGVKSGKWNHVVITAKNSLVSIFFNGLTVGSKSVDIHFPLRYGATLGAQTDHTVSWSGVIDDVRLFNRALSDSEVKAIHDYESRPQGVNPSIATAITQVVNGFVVGATITDAGSGYVSNPVVTIIGGGGTGAKASASQFNGVVTSITITNPGSGYTSTPTITIAPPPFPPRKATSTAEVVNGFVVGTKITDGGFGYDSPPAVLLIGGGGSGATAVATVENGSVTAINITNPGSGYTSATHIRIASPPFTPRLSIDVTRVRVRLEVVLGRKYQIESSADLQVWSKAGDAFIAQDEVLQQDFDVDISGRYFRINQVP